MLLALLLLLAHCVSGSYVSANFSIPPYIIYAVWNASVPQTEWLLVGAINNTFLEVVGLRSSGTVNEIMCMPTQVTRVLIQPRGCDNSNPNLAVENSNCALTPEASLANLQTMLSTWFLAWEPGTIYQFGPPILVGLPEAQFTDANLLQSQGVILTWGTGDNCAAPANVRVSIDMPTLIVTSDCTDYQSFAYTGLYAPNRAMWTEDTQWLFTRTNSFTYQNFAYSRLGVGITFNLELYDGLGGPVWLSTQAFTDFVSTPLGVNHTMVAGMLTCHLMLSIRPSNRTLLPPMTLNDVNYAQNNLPFPDYQTLVCSFDVGRFSLLNTWLVPGCCPTCLCGGDVSFTTSGLSPQPFRIRPNPQIPNMTCDMVYPLSDAVPTLGGGTLPRNFENYLCFFPFLNPDLAQETLQNAYLQCQLLSGWVADQGRTVCMRSLGFVNCKQGWLEFDQNCYYPAQSYLDARLAVTGDASEDACNSIGATAAWTPTELGYIWLGWYTAFWKDCTIPYRVARPILGTFQGSGSGNKICTCYTCTNNGTFALLVSECSCQTIAFPVCRYRYADKPVPYWQTSMSPLTRSILINGQQGAAFPGAFGQCICPYGFISNGITDGCYTPTCPPLVSNTTTALSNFFDSCFGTGNGYCYNGQPRMCQCQKGWGPPASIDPSLPFYEYQDFPCYCPSAVTHLDSYFVINGALYNDSANRIPGPPCGGFSQGACSTLDVLGVCACTNIPLLNPSSLIPYQQAFDGAACTCVVPLLPPLGQGDRIIAQFCNGKGTCCPYGERLLEQKVTGDPSTFLPRCPPAVDGCVCDTGWSGQGCTCPAPVDLASGLATYPLSYGFYVDLLQLQAVRFVVVSLAPIFSGVTCTTALVSVGDSPTSASIACSGTIGNDTWVCPGAFGSYNGFSRYVVVETLESQPSCTVEVFNNDEPPCGPNGNPTAGRFFANERYRYVVGSILATRAPAKEAFEAADVHPTRCRSHIASFAEGHNPRCSPAETNAYIQGPSCCTWATSPSSTRPTAARARPACATPTTRGSRARWGSRGTASTCSTACTRPSAATTSCLPAASTSTAARARTRPWTRRACASRSRRPAARTAPSMGARASASSS